jgi:isopropylmalate/homocitrate/citramalate synthase
MTEKIVKLTGEIPDYKVEGEPCYKKGYFWVSPHNYELVDTSNDPDFVGIHDVTLRDGEQLPGVTFLEDERVAIAEVLNEMGVTRIEAGMPAVSDIAYNALKRIAHNQHDSMIYGFARAMEKDVQLVLDSGAEGIIIEHCVNPYKCKYGYGLTPEKLVDRLVKSIRMAKKNGLRTVFMGWDWFRTPIEFTHWLIEAIVNETEFDGLTIVDTVGSTLPDAVEAMFTKFHTWYPQLELEFHGHNDFNLGNACALAAIKGGARVVHTAMNGLGERSGNIATEEVVMNLEVLKNIKTGVKLNKIDRASRLISEISKTPIPPQKPILGIRNYTIESGIATDLTRKLGERELRPSNGTILPALIGREGGELFVYGKNSGVASVVLFLEQRGLTATREEMEEILALIKREALVSKALVPEETVLYFANQVLNK